MECWRLLLCLVCRKHTHKHRHTEDPGSTEEPEQANDACFLAVFVTCFFQELGGPHHFDTQQERDGREGGWWSGSWRWNEWSWLMGEREISEREERKNSSSEIWIDSTRNEEMRRQGQEQNRCSTWLTFTYLDARYMVSSDHCADSDWLFLFFFSSFLARWI